jgi:hypothetical protein
VTLVPIGGAEAPAADAPLPEGTAASADPQPDPQL